MLPCSRPNNRQRGRNDGIHVHAESKASSRKDHHRGRGRLQIHAVGSESLRASIKLSELGSYLSTLRQVGVLCSLEPIMKMLLLYLAPCGEALGVCKLIPMQKCPPTPSLFSMNLWCRQVLSAWASRRSLSRRERKVSNWRHDTSPRRREVVVRGRAIWGSYSSRW